MKHVVKIFNSVKTVLQINVREFVIFYWCIDSRCYAQCVGRGLTTGIEINASGTCTCDKFLCAEIHVLVLHWISFLLISQKFVCEEKPFNIVTLNKAFELLNFQYMDDNKPTPLEQACLSDSGSFRQNG